MTSVELDQLETERARYESMFDTLTGLPRWSLLLDRTAVALSRAVRAEATVAVFVIDEPHFGRQPFDARAVAAILKERLRGDDTLARIGPRRFAVVCNVIRADEDAAAVARRLIYGTGLMCGLGIAISEADEPPEHLIARALEAALLRDPDPAA